MPTHRAPMRALALIVIVTVGLTSCHRRDEGLAAASREAPIRVETAAASEQPMPQYLTLTGALRASQESDIAADATGKVVAAPAERGQRVKRGQIIATLDPRTSAFAATAAAAQSKVAESQLEQARRDCDRTRHLLDTGAISQAEYDRQTAQCTSQQWSAVAAEAQQRSATKMLGDTTIRAPFDGVIGERYVNVGQYVQPSTRIASIYNPDPLRLELSVPEANVGAIQTDMPVSFSVAAFDRQLFTAHVKYISPIVRGASRDLVVEAVAPNNDGRLKPGMFAVAKLLRATTPTPVIPSAAVLRDDTGTRVYIVVGPEVQERLVQLGEKVGDLVAVVNGVSPGDRVVVRPGTNLHDGSRVE